MIDIPAFFQAHGLAQYTERVLREGFEDLETLAHVDDDSLRSMGPLLGHRTKLRVACKNALPEIHFIQRNSIEILDAFILFLRQREHASESKIEETSPIIALAGNASVMEPDVEASQELPLSPEVEREYSPGDEGFRSEEAHEPAVIRDQYPVAGGSNSTYGGASEQQLQEAWAASPNEVSNVTRGSETVARRSARLRILLGIPKFDLRDAMANYDIRYATESLINQTTVVHSLFLGVITALLQTIETVHSILELVRLTMLTMAFFASVFGIHSAFYQQACLGILSADKELLWHKAARKMNVRTVFIFIINVTLVLVSAFLYAAHRLVISDVDLAQLLAAAVPLGFFYLWLWIGAVHDNTNLFATLIAECWGTHLLPSDVVSDMTFQAAEDFLLTRAISNLKTSSGPKTSSIQVQPVAVKIDISADFSACPATYPWLERVIAWWPSPVFCGHTSAAAFPVKACTIMCFRLRQVPDAVHASARP